MKTLEEVREIFSHDRFATENGMGIDEFRDGYARCSLTIADRHKNAMGGLMGGVPFVLADFAFAVANNHEEMRTVSLSSNIAYVGVAKGETCLGDLVGVAAQRIVAEDAVHHTFNSLFDGTHFHSPFWVFIPYYEP